LNKSRIPYNEPYRKTDDDQLNASLRAGCDRHAKNGIPGAEAPFRIALAGRPSFRIANRAPSRIDLSTRPAPEVKNPNPEILFLISELVNRISDLLHKNGQLQAFLPQIAL